MIARLRASREAATRALADARGSLADARFLRAVATAQAHQLNRVVEENHFREGVERALNLRGDDQRWH